jgi:type II secretion system protein D
VVALRSVPALLAVLLVAASAEAQFGPPQDAASQTVEHPDHEPEFRTYAVDPASLDTAADQWRRRYAEAGARIAVDARNSQLVVLAAPEVHEALARELGGGDGLPPLSDSPQAGEAQAADESDLPTQRSARLQHARWDSLWPTLERLWGRRVRETASDPQQGWASYEVVLDAERAFELSVDAGRGEVTLRGPAALVQHAARLVEALDLAAAPQAAHTQVLPLRNADPEQVRYAVDALREGAATFAAHETATEPAETSDRPARRRARTLIARLLQPQPQDDPQDEFPEDEPEEEDPEEMPADEDDQESVVQPIQPGEADIVGQMAALVGDVQIEYLPDLDAIIVSGDERDVARVMQLIEDIERLSAETEPIIRVYQLAHVGSEALSTIVTQLYDSVLAPRQGRVSITPLVKPNALLLIGREENVATVVELVQQLDQPVAPASQFQVYLLKHAPAATVQATVQNFYANRTGLGPRVVVTADFRANALIVQASPRDQQEVAQLVRRLDVPTSQSVNDLRVIRLENTLAVDLAPMLEEAIRSDAQRGVGDGQQGFPQVQPAPAAPGQAGAASQLQNQIRSTMLRFVTIDPEGQQRLNSGILTDVRITADARANALLVSAPAESMELIEALIRELDHPPAAIAQIKVFTIVNGDAQRLSEMLQELFAAQGGGAGAAQQGLAGDVGETSLVELRFSVDSRTNSIIAAGSAADLNVVEAILLRLDESDVRQRESAVYRLKNAYAVEVADAINEFLRSQRDVQSLREPSPFEQIEAEVIVVPVENGNSLIVSATPRYFDEIRQIVEELDARPPMVMIQVLIAEVSLNNTDEFGVELGLQDSILFDRSLLGDLITTNTTTTFGDPPTTVEDQTIQAATLTPGFAFNNQDLGNAGSDQSISTRERTAGQALSHFSVGRVNGELGFGGLVLSASSESVSILIRALSEARRLEVLSRPQITTLDNQSAYVQVGQRVPRVTGVTINETGQVNNVQDENTGLILGVTPRISPDGLVVMEIDAEKSAVGPEAEGVPISISSTGEVVRQPLIDVTLAQTTVSALSGQTLVLGGLITKSRATTKRRVPVLSEVPVLGHLFRYDAVRTERNELLIIMTPHIIRNENDAELIKQVEAARMSWTLGDVLELHGDLGPLSRTDDWGEGQVMTIYPDRDPTGQGEPTPAEPLPLPEEEFQEDESAAEPSEEFEPLPAREDTSRLMRSAPPRRELPPYAMYDRREILPDEPPSGVLPASYDRLPGGGLRR